MSRLTDQAYLRTRLAIMSANLMGRERLDALAALPLEDLEKASGLDAMNAPNQGARLALVSLDATTRSNITVGPPFELATYEADSLVLGCRCRFDADDKYLISVRDAWNNGIQEAFLSLPKFSWESAGGATCTAPQPVSASGN